MFLAPVDGYANDDVAREEEAEDSEEWADPAEKVPRPPRHGRSPDDLKGHHKKGHLKK